MSAPFELLLAGWALSLAFGCLLARCHVRNRAMRARVADALHELRRPLQAMALAGDQAAMARQLEAALPALEDLQRGFLGASPGLLLRRVELRPLVEAAVGRWGSQAEDSSAGVELLWSAGDARAVVDTRRLAQALDNLIANALEHGHSPVIVEAAPCAAGLRLSVRNRVRSTGGGGELPNRGALAGGSKARGHGLRIVSAIASAHGGRFLFDCSAGWAVGVLELPLARRAHGTAVAT